ncbi:hypothetical protein cypCar_00020436 [Cyprinus carpio]|nr:hypothetical protein cypCar_00020436 [Cyprinus carpio]
MDLLHEQQAETEKLSKLKGQMQSKVAEYLSKKTGDKDPRLEEIYQTRSSTKSAWFSRGALMQHHSFSELQQQRTEELRQQSSEKLNQVQHELRSSAALKHEAAMTALTVNVCTQAALVQQLQEDQLKQEDQLASVHLYNIKFKNRSEIRFCDHQEHPQGISHVKEKLHFVQMESKVKHTQLVKADTLVALKCEVLTCTRQARDGLRADNLKLQQRCGLLGNTTLLQDFEEKVDTSECLQQRLELSSC